MPDTLQGGPKPEAGYSGKPLAQKLGIQSGARVVAIDAPTNYRELLDPLPHDVRLAERIGREESFVHVFATDRRRLGDHLANLRQRLADNGILWVSWPKKSAKTKSDISEDVVRELALPLGLVDVKVCAVDATWSGLKLMIRRENRCPAKSKPPV